MNFMSKWKRNCLVLLLWGIIVSAPLSAARLSYDVQILGIENRELATALQNTSDLVALQKRPPASMNGLRYRIRADIPQLLQVLRAYAYYDAEIDYEVQTGEGTAHIDLIVHPGPQYQLSSYSIYGKNCTQPLELSHCPTPNAETLHLIGNPPALSMTIVNAEENLLSELGKCGHPLALINKRKVIVDLTKKTVSANVCVQEGPLSRFGPSSLFGLKNVEPRYIERKIAWEEGQIYDQTLVDETQKRLLKSELFSSILISHPKMLDEEGELPMKLRFTESSHRNFSLGAFYATVDGPGLSLAWAHRNLRGMGEQLSIQSDLSQRFVGGKINYRKPDFGRFEQSLSLLAEITRERIHPYHALTYRESNVIERRMGEKDLLSIGLKGEYINVTQSANDGFFFLLGLPFLAKYSSADSPLDPTKGISLSYFLVPYQSFKTSSTHFIKQVFTTSAYIPLTEKRKIVLALHAQLGSIAGTARHHIPLPILFLGGSEDDLRGYRYKTVSPLNERGQPLGGRSAIFTSIETRFRVSEKIALVPFADFGTVRGAPWPTFQGKWRKSVGLGFRYFTFFGPLRFDAGFPLNRRPIDSWVRFYASVGQAF